jgi:hypothetical protein
MWLALELARDDADVLRALGDEDAREALHTAAVGPVGVHGPDVVQPVRERHDLQVCAVLAHLLDTAVQVADDRLGLRDDLAVDVRDHAAHTVRRGVRGTDVDDELLRGRAVLHKDRRPALDVHRHASHLLSEVRAGQM